jgi:non-specific serine/threonine protein kinase
MQIAKKLTDIFDKVKLVELLNIYGNIYEAEVKYILLRNGYDIPIRRQINDYYTFVVNDEKAENVIIKKSSIRYGATCSCKIFHTNDVCPHVISVLKSCISQMESDFSTVESNSIETKSATNIDQIYPLNFEIDKNTPFVIGDAGDMSIGKLIRLFPFIQGMQMPGKTLVNNLDRGKQIVCRYLNEKFYVNAEVNNENDLVISCSCTQTYKGKICEHSRFAIAYLAYQFNKNLLVPFLNQDKEKNKILAEYGLQLSDAEAKEFSFSLNTEGQVYLKEAPARFKNFRSIDKIRHVIEHASKQSAITRKRQRFIENFDAHKIGICFCINDETQINQPIYIEPYRLDTNKRFQEKATRLPLSNPSNLGILSNLDDAKFDTLMLFSFDHYKYFLRSEVTFAQYQNFIQKNTPELRKAYISYFYETLYDQWEAVASWPLKHCLNEKKTFHYSNLEPIELSEIIITPEISVTDSEKFIEVSFHFVRNQETFNASEVTMWNGRIIKIGNTIYRHDKPEMYDILEMLEEGHMLFPQSQRAVVIQEVIFPLAKTFKIAVPESLSLEIESYEMSPMVRLAEDNQKLLTIEAMCAYGDIVIPFGKKAISTYHDHLQARYISRDILAEEEFFNFLCAQYPAWQNATFGQKLVISFDEVMKNNWFITFTKTLLDKGIKIDGIDKLQRFKFNPNTPKWEMSVSSGIDWFDLHITASWGNQILGFKELRKAISNGQNFVVLPDGSLGSIPDEWLAKYGLVLKLSKDEDAFTGRISKKQFGIIDLLYSEINEAEIKRELDEKKENLYQLNKFKPEPIPSQIRAQLRPYQEAGFQWMQMLDKISWGGCLADDMGLGKTLQAITFLQYIKNNRPSLSLVVCPTSLIYNWQLEFDKFAPDLKYYIYYGLGRANEKVDFSDYDIIITSYGIARNDVEILMDINWEYIILDESQTIKNPDAGITKALMLYKARNKFVLSGTPMQNNTFDLYAQFHFLNPGILGSREFFRSEFATQIDKNNNKDAVNLLKKIIKPFMLRRTKAEVAIDLPEKTESVIWCEMEEDQKQLYNNYKDFYRGALTQRIANEGLAKSGVYILEGLLRLRQICDDPRLIKSDMEAQNTKGVKIKELVREIKENIGNHKILIFSQFTEMLGLIRQDLDHDNISYAYLDGSTNIQKRKNQIEDFQNNEEMKIFLISLKAGGIGLNLTSADYVYIVDPWWNPAVEQQAIDRAHRIGQKNNIFAYKMICKGTVEEKILHLQEKKLSMTKDIVGEDSAFFKKLTVEDIHYLFS